MRRRRRIIRHINIGQAPGTLRKSEAHEPVQITCFRYNGTQINEHTMSDLNDLSLPPEEEKTTWKGETKW